MKKVNVLVLPLLLFLLGCNSSDKSNTITIFHAGSLSLPLKAAADSFMKANPGVQVVLESAGSVECSRKITELGRKCDLFFSADYNVIKNLLLTEYATYFIPFASNKMVVAYRPDSRLADSISADSWIDILLNQDVRYGRSDPNNDPCGYRTVLLLELAEKYYSRTGVASQILAKDNKYIRPKEVDLIALLEAGAIDYFFIYESVALQHDLSFLSLPDSINLGNPDLSDYYSSVSTQIKGSKPDEVLSIHGEPILYAFTIPTNAPNAELAQKFASFFLSKNGGLSIVEAMGQNVLVPFNPDGCGEVPKEFLKFAKMN
ncbi:extracellular solute-binding protein [Tenuifilum thalassicum]|uniref:Extracellular solute-binding protein n=1 Tax=Tenuifilum thalassicum TaxID=2590900 RepID=A0A7D3XWA3_9BACT|nr:extracellular solute-binding protein [Tenuifilum thalassicum]QKG80528.1 extracellular solute-binding protein [Tenuifilum thalassicum]